MDAVQIVLSDPHYWGGLRQTQHLGKLCRSFGLGLSMHSNTHLGVSLMAMTHAAAATPHLSYACDTHYPWQSGEDEVVAGGRIPFVDGCVRISEKPGLGVELSPLGVRDAPEIERAIAAFAQRPNGGMILIPTAPTFIHRQLIIDLAARHRLPTIYPYRYFVAAGGLICYGPNEIEQYRQAAGYVDRILKGEKPADLPVQAPTKYETVLNLKTAKALGIEVPATVRVRADEVIE